MDIHFSPLAYTIRLYKEGDSFKNRDPVAGEMHCQITHIGERAYLQAIRGEIDLTAWRAIKSTLIQQGVQIIEYHHHGKLISYNTETGKTHCERCDSDEITYDDFKPCRKACWCVETAKAD